MGTRKNGSDRQKQTLWRTGALQVARALKADMQTIVGRITYNSGKVWIDQADRHPGGPWQRSREWSEYIENRPDLLTRTADELEMIARSAAALALSFRKQAGVASRRDRAEAEQ